jgi:hypothetical protein
VKNNKTYRRAPDYNGSGVFLRGNAAAIGIKQWDNFASHSHSINGQGSNRGTCIESDGYGWENNGSHYGFSVLSAGYTGDNETRPVNFAVCYYIKY